MFFLKIKLISWIVTFIDIRLRELLPKCDKQTQTASILDASIQTQLMGKNLKQYMNKYKAGGEESFEEIGYSKQQRKQLEEFIKSRWSIIESIRAGAYDHVPQAVILPVIVVLIF